MWAGPWAISYPVLSAQRAQLWPPGTLAVLDLGSQCGHGREELVPLPPSEITITSQYSPGLISSIRDVPVQTGPRWGADTTTVSI